MLPCARRINVEAVDAAVTPIARPRAGGIFGDIVFDEVVNEIP
jgi:hypothetical protein